MKLSSASLVVLVLVSGLGSFAACASTPTSGFGETDAEVDAGSPFNPGLANDATVVNCTGLECARPKDCPGGTNTTTISGTVFAPNGTDPLYNALVFVPNGELKPFDDQVACETCEKSVSGEPLGATLTDTSGKFTLKDMPAGKDIPLVVQIGRFRRKVVLPAVAACADTKVTAAQSRLPKNQTEGDIPRIAIVSSTYDPTECILMEIGIDASEFTAPSGNGRIHLYRGNGNQVAGSPDGNSLWNDEKTLKNYQLVAMPCSSYPASGGAALENLYKYANAGGRIFATDLSYPVVSTNKPEWVATGNWAAPGSYADPASIDTSFPKGQAMADWLKNVGAISGTTISLQQTYSRVGTINAPAQRWLYSGSNTQSYTFNTPVNAEEKNQCGRVFYSSFHIGSGRSVTGTFPGACQSKPLTPQERVLEFMLFDLASCVLSDKQPPTPPK
ncbi:MAG: hypothetical protein U0174_00935 [Polyangiaceae bacterium]